MKIWFKILFLVSILIALITYITLIINHQPKEESKQIPIGNENCVCPTDNNLPIIVIDTHGQLVEAKPDYIETTVNGRVMNLRDKSPKFAATLKLYEPGGYTCICDEGVPTLETDILINVRGQSSMVNPKKQYTISLRDKNGEENYQEILGLPKHDKWVLNASYGDKSLIRNYLAYKMAGQVMEYAPRTRFVEVYLNDNSSDKIDFDRHYIGVYLLTEKIERGLDRVNLTKNEDKYNDISFIIARDKINVGDAVLQTYWSTLEDDFIIDEYGNIRNRTVITISYPGPSLLTPKLENKIINYLNEFEYTLKSNDFNDRRKGYRKYIEVDSFVNLAMINEIFKNIDGGDVSTYFYKDIGGLMVAGPVWDFDLTLGNTPYEHANEPTGFRMINTLWFDRLFQDPYFALRYSKILYPYYRKNIWRTKKVINMIDEAVAELGPSIDRNINRWYKDYNKEDYLQEIEDIKDFFIRRLSWMDENIHLVKRLMENVTD